MKVDNKDCEDEVRVKTGLQSLEACPPVVLAFCYHSPLRKSCKAEVRPSNSRDAMLI
jgi:hypothetical protein